MYDVIIIGAGPAGLTAAIYLLRADKKVLIIEKNGIGGQIASSQAIENYPGFIKISGADFSNNLYEQVCNLGGEIVIEEVLSIDKEKNVKTDYGDYKAKAILVATGCKYRTLGLEYEEEFIGKGIHFCVSCDGTFYKNKDVAVIGGGNSAVGNAIALADICNKVYLIQNLDELTADKKDVELLNKKNNVEIIYKAKVNNYLVDSDFKGLKIISDDKTKNIYVNGVFLAIGLVPESDFIKNIINLDESGYVNSNDGITNVSGIFVAGDVRKKEVRQLTVATSDGTIVALKIIDYLAK